MATSRPSFLVPGSIHLTHAPLSYEGDDLVRAKVTTLYHAHVYAQFSPMFLSLGCL